MKSIELYSTSVLVEGYEKSRHANYRYILLESEKEIELLDRKVILPCFGIEIVREDIEGEQVYSIEKDMIECMTTYRYKVVQILKKLYDGCVSPIHLIEIAGPIADEWVNDFDIELSRMAAQ